MTIPLTTTEGLFRRLGRVGYVALSSMTGQQGVQTGINGLIGQYQVSDHTLVSQLETVEDPIVRSVPTAPLSVVTPVAAATLTTMVSADRPSVPRSTRAMISELIRQMRAASESVPACAVTCTAVAFSSPSNTGDGVLVLSTKRGDGMVAENAAAEAGLLTCTADSYSGAVTAGAETFAYTGTPQTAGTWDYNYPTGSSGRATLTAASPAAGPLSNQSFESWSGSPLAADSWTISGGTWATDVYRYAASFDPAGTYCLALKLGVTPFVYQAFGPLPQTTAYAVAVRLKMKTATGTGTVKVELTDGANAVTADDQSVSNTLTVDVSTLTTTDWTTATAVFRTPTLTPATGYRLRIRVSTVIATSDVLVDDLVWTPLTTFSQGGCSGALIAGVTPFLAGDGWTVTTTNDRAGAALGLTWQALFDRLFGTRALGLLLPSSVTPTISDNLISDSGDTPMQRFVIDLGAASGTTDLIAAPGAGLFIRVYGFVLSAAGASKVTLQDDTPTSLHATYATDLTGGTEVVQPVTGGYFDCAENTKLQVVRGASVALAGHVWYDILNTP